jgi:hypothetical protein
MPTMSWIYEYLSPSWVLDSVWNKINMLRLSVLTSAVLITAVESESEYIIADYVDMQLPLVWCRYPLSTSRLLDHSLTSALSGQ